MAPQGREPPTALQHERVRYAFTAVVGQGLVDGLKLTGCPNLRERPLFSVC